jgi:DNA invertase Pin-like site-specific DNA recombinase
LRFRVRYCVAVLPLDTPPIAPRVSRDLGELIERLQPRGMEPACVADKLDKTKASGRLVLTVMGSVAQWEREIIGGRTADALVHLRTNRKRVSRFAPFSYQPKMPDNAKSSWATKPRIPVTRVTQSNPLSMIDLLFLKNGP